MVKYKEFEESMKLEDVGNQDIPGNIHIEYDIDLIYDIINSGRN